MTISEDASGPDEALAPVDLIVCATCRRGRALEPDERRPGESLHEALAARDDLPDGVRVQAARCLSNCSRGCSIALRGAGRWTYVYGDIDEARDVDAIVEGVMRYWRAADGVVPWRERPERFRKHCIARVPPLETLND